MDGRRRLERVDAHHGLLDVRVISGGREEGGSLEVGVIVREERVRVLGCVSLVRLDRLRRPERLGRCDREDGMGSKRVDPFLPGLLLLVAVVAVTVIVGAGKRVIGIHPPKARGRIHRRTGCRVFARSPHSDAPLEALPSVFFVFAILLARTDGRHRGGSQEEVEAARHEARHVSDHRGDHGQL